MINLRLRSAGGQALMELLVSLGVGTLILGSVAGITAVILQTNSEIRKMKTATDLAQELIDNVRIYADSNWKTAYELEKGAGNQYYIDISGAYAATAGSENVTVDEVIYNRYFYLDDVSRADSDNSIVDAGGTNDPATQKITVMITWDGNSEGLVFNEYLSRYRNFVIHQSDWSGGYTADSPLSIAGDIFSTSTAAEVGTEGEMKIEGY